MQERKRHHKHPNERIHTAINAIMRLSIIILLPLIHLCVVLLVLAGGDIVHPFLIVEIPADGLFDTFLELEGGLPTELVLELGGVDSVAQVVAGAVGHIGDELLAGALGVAEEAVDGLDDHLHDVDILPLVEASDIVGIAGLSLMENHIDGAGVVHHIEPVAHVFALAIDGERLAVADIVDEEGDELLRELVGAVVVRAVGHQRGHAVGVVIGAHEVVAAGLGGAVGAVRVVLGGLVEELASIGGRSFGLVELQSAVNLIRRDVVEALAFPVAVPVLAGGLQQAEGTHHIGAGEGKRVFDGAIHVALCGQVDDAIDIVLLHDGAHAVEVADIGLHEGVVRLVLDILQVGEVAGVGERIEIDDAILGVLVDEEADDVGADEAGTTCNQDVFHLRFLIYDLRRRSIRIYPASRLPFRQLATPRLSILDLRVLKHGDAALQGSMPMRDGEAEGGADFGLIQDGEGGTLYLAGELAAVAGIHLTGAAGKLTDGYGEVVPGAHALVAVVVDAFGGCGGVQDGTDGICQVAGVGGGADLVEHDVEAGAAGHETEHGFHEVLAMDGVEPGGADDDAAAAAFQNSLLARELGAAIGTERVGGEFFGSRSVTLASEHVVGAHVHEQGALCLGCGGQIGGSGGIDKVGQVFVVLCGVYIGVGGAVDDGAHALGGFEHGGGIGDIELGHIGEDELMPAAHLGGHAAHFIAQLAVGSCYENFHDLIEGDVDIEIVRCVCQSAAAGVLGGEDDICCGELPVDAEGGVIPGDAAFAVGSVVVIALVLEDGLLAQHGKTMGKATGDEELAVVLGTELHGHMLAEGGGTLADIHRYVEDPALDTAHELALAMRGALIVQTTQHAVAGHGLVILHEGGVAHLLLELAVGEGFVEIAASIAEDAGFDDDYAGNGCGNDFHL